MNMRTIAVLAFVALAACGKTQHGSGEPPSGKVTITKFSQNAKGDEYTITLNDVLAIHNVTIKDGDGGKSIVFPGREDRDGKMWSYVRVSRGDADFLLDQLESNKPTNSPKDFEVTATKVTMMDKPGILKARVEFELNGGAVKLSSWSILLGKRGANLVSPREKSGEDWKDILYPATKEFHDKLQEAALAEYVAQGGVTDTAPPSPTDTTASNPASDTGHVRH